MCAQIMMICAVFIPFVLPNNEKSVPLHRTFQETIKEIQIFIKDILWL